MSHSFDNPGQTVVFYSGDDIVFGGGVIEKIYGQEYKNL
jgi:tRNA U34 2-thiouridine synthase MnmA/TrmU